MMSGMKTTVTRTYKSFLRVVSEIGGINSVIFLIFYYLNIFYTHYAKKKIMSKLVYDFLDWPSFAYKKYEASTKVSARKETQ